MASVAGGGGKHGVLIDSTLELCYASRVGMYDESRHVFEETVTDPGKPCITHHEGEPCTSPI